MNRRLLFTLMFFIGVGLDMTSTYLAVTHYGAKEMNPFFNVFIKFSPFLLFIYVAVLTMVIYWLYPKSQRLKFNVHLETIIILFAIFGLFAGIGNISQLFYKDKLVLSFDGNIINEEQLSINFNNTLAKDFKSECVNQKEWKVICEVNVYKDKIEDSSCSCDDRNTTFVPISNELYKKVKDNKNQTFDDILKEVYK